MTIQVQKMMADPAFKAQAEQAAQAMKGGGMDFGALAQQMGATMGGGGGGGGGPGAGGAASEMERLRRETLTPTLAPAPALTLTLAPTLTLTRLRRENAMLKQHLGNKGEL